MKNNVWEEFFDNHAPEYMKNIFTRNTEAEIKFLIEELNLPKGAKILDIGCGTGRHSVGLAQHGFEVTGVDISRGMLVEAAKTAKQAGVTITLINCDATEFQTDTTFDIALTLCEGAFALFAPDQDVLEHDLSILRNIHAALKSGGKLIMTTLNAMKKIREYGMEDIKSGKFDPINLVEYFEMEYVKEGRNESVRVCEKGYVVPELKMLLNMAGFEIENVWGGTAGNWGRRQIDPDEYEIMVTAKKI